MKKFVSILLALMMVLSMMAFASAEGPIEISITHNWSSGANYEEMEYLIGEFNKANEGKIHVTGVYIAGGYSDVLAKFNVSYAVQENPVVSIIDACMTMGEVQKNTMIDLTAYAQEHDPEYDFGQFMPGMLLFSTDFSNNHIYSLPYGRSTQLMYLNMDLIEQAIGEKKVPETWDDIEAICEAWYAKTGKPGYGHSIIGNFFAWYINTMNKGEYFNRAGTGICPYVNDGWTVALTTWREYMDKGWYDVPAATSGAAGFWEHFQAGELPIAFGSSGSIIGTMQKAEEAGFELNLAVLPGGLQEDGSIFRRVSSGGSNLMIANNKTEEETAAAWEFVKYMTSFETNIHHSFATGYVLTHVGCEDDPGVQEQWAANPLKKVGYDQIQYVDEPYVSPCMQEYDLEVVQILKEFVYDGVSVEDTLAALISSAEEIFPDGVVDSAE